MKLSKFINIISFNQFTKSLSENQNPDFINHAGKLIKDNNYTDLLEMLENSYLLTKEQNNIIANKIINFIYNKNVNDSNTDYTTEAKMSECFQKYGNKKIFSYCLNNYFKKTFLDFGNGNRYGDKRNSFTLNYYLDGKFISTFFYKLGLDSFNQNKDIPSLEKEAQNNLLKNFLQILINTLNEIINSSQLNKQKSINYITQTTPIEFYPYIYRNVEKLHNSNNKNSEISLYEKHNNHLNTENYKKNNKFSENGLERIEHLQIAYNYAQKFIFNKYEDKADQRINKHTTIINALKNKSNQQLKESDKNFEVIDFSKIYNLSEISPDIIYIIKSIQNKYLKLQNSQLDSESSYKLSKISKSVFQTLDNYEITKDFLYSAGISAEDNLKIIHHSISNILENEQLNKIKNLEINNKKQFNKGPQ